MIAAVEEAKDFALAGGAALIMREQIERVTRDLDFFGLSAAAVDRLVPSVERALRRAGFDVERVISGTGFARLVVQGLGGADRGGFGGGCKAASCGTGPGRYTPVDERGAGRRQGAGGVRKGGSA